MPAALVGVDHQQKQAKREEDHIIKEVCAAIGAALRQKHFPAERGRQVKGHAGRKKDDRKPSADPAAEGQDQQTRRDHLENAGHEPARKAPPPRPVSPSPRRCR